MTFSRFILLCLMLLLAACSDGVDNNRIRVDVVSNSGEFSVAKFPLNKQSAYLRAATAQGLVTFDPQGRVLPALASRWMVTDDGRSYIFRLNKSRWNNGAEIEAADVANALNTQINAMRKRRFSAALDNIIRVDRMTGRVLQIRLKAPMPNLLEYLALPEFGIVHKSNGSGPMIARTQAAAMMLRLRVEDNSKEMILSERRVFLFPNKAATALARIQAGDSDLIVDGTFGDIPKIAAAAPSNVTSDYSNSLGQFGLLLVEAGPFLSVPDNREAIAMAIDRPRMLTAFEGAEWRERTSLVQDNIEDRGAVARPDWTSMNMQARKAKARGIINRWKSSNGNIRSLRVAMPKSPGSRLLFAWLRADLAAIGLSAEMVAMNANADFRLIDRTADSSSAAWYLNQLSCKMTVFCSSEADALVEQARAAPTLAERKQLFGEAETLLQEKRNFIPIANPIRWTMQREGLLGYASNPRGWHYLQYLGRDPT